MVDLGTVVTDVTGKQDKLVSGTNIKTINGASILGSGDIAISGGGSSDKVDVVTLYPEVNGNEWTYHIPAGKFVNLWPTEGTVPSHIYFELLDPVECTLESEGDWASELSKYHFSMYWSSAWSFSFVTNINPTAMPNFVYNDINLEANCVEFDVVCAIIHYPASTGYPDVLYGNITAASLYYN